MKFLKLIPILFIFFGNVPYKNEVHAEIKNPEDFRVLSNESKKLSISNVEYFIKEGDKYITKGDFEKAKEYIKTEKPEVAVPLLVETIRIMSPNSPEGKEAYERLIQLGFVETKYKG